MCRDTEVRVVNKEQRFDVYEEVTAGEVPFELLFLKVQVQDISVRNRAMSATWWADIRRTTGRSTATFQFHSQLALCLN